MAILGFIYLILTFVVCFITVHVIKLAVIGLRSMRKKKAEPKIEKPQKKNEPVYYIVERKRARKSVYSEPKEIQFKK